ncbi:MAG TPA: hypothetical protein VMW42_03625 [Desulfatiglandales bacterium]|nr:hypothetical protein [Desulfobacterales bacterium]HUU40011.1 hypothetical protein [Desulfatiglandales bacterium]
MKIDGYKFGQKNNWRKWVWNRICERLTVPKKDAVIVYLAGIEDMDRTIACQKGFNPNNMIAVDKNKKVIQSLKEKGALHIHSDLTSALIAFGNTKTKIDVLIGDFCCGLVYDIEELAVRFPADAIGDAFNDNAVIMMNFLRGRDNGGMLEIRDTIENTSEKHRGKLFIEFFLRSAAMWTDGLLFHYYKHQKPTIARAVFQMNFKEKKVIHENEEPDPIGYENYLSKEMGYDKLFGSTIDFHMYRIKNGLNAVFNSYKSGNMVMDSTVFLYAKNVLVWGVDKTEEIEAVKSLTRKISSTLAVRTMKQKGVLKPSPTI